jgi:hypothetical protein
MLQTDVVMIFCKVLSQQEKTGNHQDAKNDLPVTWASFEIVGPLAQV